MFALTVNGWISHSETSGIQICHQSRSHKFKKTSRLQGRRSELNINFAKRKGWFGQSTVHSAMAKLVASWDTTSLSPIYVKRQAASHRRPLEAE